MTFDEVTRTRPGPGSALVWDVPDGWQQGRGAFGGLTLAMLARAAGATLDAAERPLRTITAELPGAVMVGHATVHVETLRAGSGVTTVAARVEQGGAVVAHAVLTFGKTRAVDLDREGAPPPSPPPFAEVPPAPALPMGPVFTQHLEYRVIRGVPFAGEPEASVEGWVRLRAPGDVPRPIALIGLIDGWFPSVLPLVTAPRPFGTIAFAAHLFDRAWSLGEPLYHRARLLSSQQGYFVELRELYTPRGELCAVNQQTMAIIK